MYKKKPHSHLTFEPPNPVLLLTDPKFEEPSPRSSELEPNIGCRPLVNEVGGEVGRKAP